MNKKHKTFSERARKIVKLYPRADFDETEKNELNERLGELAAEQEQYKIDNGLAEEPQQEQFPLGGWFNNDPTYVDYDGNKLGREVYPNMEYMTPMSATSVGSGYMSQPTLDFNQTLNPLITRSADSNSNIANPYGSSGGNISSFKDKMSNFGDNLAASGAMQYIPSIATGAVSMIGNAMMADKARKNKQNLLNMVDDYKTGSKISPSLLNLTAERSAINKDFQTAKNVAMQKTKGLARGRGELMSSIINANTLADKNRARAISQSYLNEAKYNTGAINQANMFNAQNASERLRLKLGIEQQGNAQEMGYKEAMWQIPGQVSQDLLKQYNQNQMIKSLGDDYVYVYDTNRKWWQMPQYKRVYRG